MEFLSTLPARGATGHKDLDAGVFLISIHAPREGSDRGGWLGRRIQQDFYPRSPRGERRYRQWFSRSWKYFYPRSPRGERRVRSAQRQGVDTDFYPRSPRGERLLPKVQFTLGTDISIHAPREGSDVSRSGQSRSLRYFYPRSPRGERRKSFRSVRHVRVISIHAPREGSDHIVRKDAVLPKLISIHAPREGSDIADYFGLPTYKKFLSTLPARGATRIAPSAWRGPMNFYPRSPRGERRTAAWPGRRSEQNFYPRSPRGERPGHMYYGTIGLLFLSTLPARGATCIRNQRRLVPRGFLSTLPARGATGWPRAILTMVQHFYPRSPRGERRAAGPWQSPTNLHFYPRSPRGERRTAPSYRYSAHTYFYPRSPRGERPGRCSSSYVSVIFLSTLPARGATLGWFCCRTPRSNFYPRSPRGERP